MSDVADRVGDDAVVVRRYGNRTSTLVHEIVDEVVTAAGRTVHACGFEPRGGHAGDTAESAHGAQTEILVFPVLGDERLPDHVDRWLHDHGTTPDRHLVVVTGDFTAGRVPTSRVSTEADRLLTAGGSVPARPPILIDTPLTAGWDVPVRIALTDALLGAVPRPSSAPASSAQLPNAPLSIAPASSAPAENRPHPQPGTFDGLLAELCDLTIGSPSIDIDGHCIALDLTDGAAYPRSLLQHLTESELARVFDLVGALDRLERLSLAFAGIEKLPSALPPSLLELDLTGNPAADFSVLDTTPDLLWLNIAACDLVSLPEEIAGLGRLHTLIAAKNRLSTIPSWLNSATGLHRATFYRNQFTRPLENLTALPELRILNVGASPVSDLGAVGPDLPELRALGVCMTELTELPTWVTEHPTLEAVDVSKNPGMQNPGMQNPGLKHPAGQGDGARGRGPQLTSAMPGWDSFGSHRPGHSLP